MGFFSSRKAVDNDNYQVAIGVATAGGSGGSKEETSVVRVIRSRFYNKKGKDREDAILYHNASPSPPSNNPVASSPLSAKVNKRSNTTGGHTPTPGPGILRNHSTNALNASASSSATITRRGNTIPSIPNHPYALAEAKEASSSSTSVGLKPLPATPARVGSLRAKPSLFVATNTPPPPRIPSGSMRSKPKHSPHAKQLSATSSNASPRKDTDTVTVTLAQRLNELAVANQEGLLNDDEYRLLRQNLFERFSTSTAVPSEAPMVPLTPVRPRPPKEGGTPDRPTSRPMSNNFHVERPMSIMSKSSATSGVASLFRRVTDRRSASKDMSDTSSIWSGKSSMRSNSIFRMPRLLSRKGSDSSVDTTFSRNQGDTMSISSRRSHRGHAEGSSSLYPTTPRSAAGSIRRMAHAPSSFNAKAIMHEKDRSSAIYNVFDENHLSTVKDIQQEISNIEGEARRLMDAFNGLEVTTLAKNQRHRSRRMEYGGSHHGGGGSAGRSAGPESAWGDSDGRSQRRVHLGDNSDAISMRSGVSIGTSAPSLAARSTYSYGSRRLKGTLPSPMAAAPLTPSSLSRKASIVSSTDTPERRIRPLPPVPALPEGISNGHLKTASTSNVSLLNKSSSHLPMGTVLEDDKSLAGSTANTLNTSHTVHAEEVEETETDLDDIRRRREEVSQRYEARLEFLRAKLKGAQLHEKLMRK